MKVLQEILVPQESVNDEFLIVVEILFINGTKVNEKDVVIVLETSKTTISIETDVEGYIEYLCKIDDEVAVNALIIKIWDEKVPIENNENINDILSSPVVVETKEVKEKIFVGEYETIFSSKALQLISANNISENNFKALDFVNEDVILRHLNPDYLGKSHLSDIPKIKISGSVKTTPVFDKNKVILNRIGHSKKREIENLMDVQSSGLVSIINIDLDTKNFFESINDHLLYFKDSVLPVIVYECSRLLVKYPLLNAYYLNNEIATYTDVNIGVAMDIDNGLKVVKIPDTNKLNLIAVEENIFQLANKYIDKRLDTSDLTDITFTITDLSSYGVYSFSPLINKNNSAILGISKIDEKLERVILSLAFDHRVTEGKIAALFLQDLKDRFESYSFKNKNKNNIKNICCSKCMKTLDEDLNDIGFIKVVNKKGEDKYICELCLLRF